MAPFNDGGSPITGYVVEKKDKYGEWEKAVEVGPYATSATVPDLIEGQPYEFRVRAVNKAGLGEPSDATPTIIAKPRNMAPKIDRTNLIDMKVKAGTNFGFDVKVSGEPAPKTKWMLGPRDVKTGERVKIKDVPYNTNLQVRMSTREESGKYTITAENINGKDIAYVTVIVLDKPGMPEGPLKVSDITGEGCNLSWKPPEDDGGQPIEKYVVEKLDETTGRWVPAGETIGPDTSLQVEGLIPNHKYKFRVRAVNKQGKSEPLATQTSIEAKNLFGMCAFLLSESVSKGKFQFNVCPVVPCRRTWKTRHAKDQGLRQGLCRTGVDAAVFGWWIANHGLCNREERQVQPYLGKVCRSRGKRQFWKSG